MKSGAAEELVEGLLPRYGVNVAVGDSNIGKTPLAVQLLVCVATGLPFLGCKTIQGKAHILDYENTGLLSDMIEKISRCVGADPAVVEENLSILDREELQTMSFEELFEETRDHLLVVVD